MKSKASRVLDAIYIEMYKVAVPSVDLIPYLKENNPDEKIDYKNHWLPREVQIGIERRLCKQAKLRTWETSKIHTSLCLGASPNTSYRNWFINMLQQKSKNTDFYKRFKTEIDDALDWGMYNGEFI